MSRRFLVAVGILVLFVFLIPIEHKYDKWFRFFSIKLIPEGLSVTGQYEKKIYFYLSDFLALALTWIGLVSFRIPLKKWFASPLWIVWICAFLSILVSPFSHYPIPYFRLLQLFTPIALFSFIAHAFSEEEKEKALRAVLIAVVFAGVIQAVIGTVQYFHQGPLGLRLLGEVKRMSYFSMPEGSRWLFDSILGIQGKSTFIRRAQGTLPHANVFGGFLVLSIMATYFLAKEKSIWLITLPLQLFALAVSYSRSALLGWVIGSTLWFFFAKLKGQKKTLFVLAASIFAISILTFNQYFHRTNFANGSDNIRKIHHQTALEIIQDNPFFGLGFTQFSEKASPYFAKEASLYVSETAPHNIFLFLASETGLISLFAFLFFLMNLLWRARDPLFISLLCAFIFIGLCDFYPILSQQGRAMFFLIASLAHLRINVLKQTPVYG